MDKGTERVRFRLFSGAVWLEQKSKGVGQNQARGLKWPTKRQRLYPKGSEEFPRTCLLYTSDAADDWLVV